MACEKRREAVGQALDQDAKEGLGARLLDQGAGKALGRVAGDTAL
jgi:hypothetical protein